MKFPRRAACLLFVMLLSCKHVSARAECLNIERFVNDSGQLNTPKYALGDVLVLNHDSKIVTQVANIKFHPNSIERETKPSTPSYSLERYLQILFSADVNPSLKTKVQNEIMNSIKLELSLTGRERLPNAILELNQMLSNSRKESLTSLTAQAINFYEQVEGAQKEKKNQSFVIVSSVTSGTSAKVRVEDSQRHGAEVKVRGKGATVDVSIGCKSMIDNEGDSRPLLFTYIPLNVQDGLFIHDVSFSHKLSEYRPPN